MKKPIVDCRVFPVYTLPRMTTESRPSRLMQIQNQANILGAQIERRQRMQGLINPQGILRSDPDLQDAAREHAAHIISKTIPASLSRLEARLESLGEEREDYINGHAPELIASAEEHQADMAREKRVLARLERELQREFTSNEVLSRRRRILEDLEARRNIDPDLQAGYELIARREQAQQETQIAPEKIEGQPKGVLFPTALPRLSGKLIGITYAVEEDKTPPSESVFQQVRKANLDPLSTTPEQKQALENVEFLGPLAESRRYQDIYTPAELDTFVRGVSEFVTKDGVCGIAFQRTILQVLSKNPAQYEKISGKSIDGLKKAVKDMESNPPKLLDPKQVVEYSKLVSQIIRTSSRKLLESGYLINIKDQPGKEGESVKAIFQAAFDIVGRLVYDTRSITRKKANIKNFQANRQTICAWYEEVGDLLEEIASADRGASETVTDIRRRIQQMQEIRPELVLDQEIKFAIGRLQLEVGRLVDYLNGLLPQISQRLAQEELITKEQIAAEDIPSDVPSLLGQLHFIDSPQIHKYNPDATVGAKLKQVLAYPPSQRTLEQEQLLSDVQSLKRFTNSENFMDVYTPEELRGLVETLSKLSKKHRPDFDELERKIIDTIDDQRRKDHQERDGTLKGLIERADQDAPGRRGMNWDTLRKFASKASAIIINNSLESRSPERMSYLVDVFDPSPDENDLSPVYQFAAYSFALVVIGHRSIEVDRLRSEAFVANCQVVNDWYERLQGTLEVLSRYHRFKGVCFNIKEMVETMNDRLTGNETTGYKKRYSQDPAGAIRLQQRIGYTIETLKFLLETIEKPPTQEQIEPLE